MKLLDKLNTLVNDGADDDRIAALLLRCSDEDFADLESRANLSELVGPIAGRVRRIRAQGIDDVRWRWRVYESLSAPLNLDVAPHPVDGDEQVGTRFLPGPSSEEIGAARKS